MIKCEEIKWFEIADAQTGNIIARGHNIAYKTNGPKNDDMCYLSVDGKWFFNTESERFKIRKIENPDEMSIVEFTEQDNYKWLYWSDYFDNSIEIYRDWSIDEVDEEVRSLVIELNKWEDVQTCGSCCGHGKQPLWVQMSVGNAGIFNVILNILRSPKVFPKMLNKFEIRFDTKFAFTLCYYPEMKSNEEKAPYGYITTNGVMQICLMTTDKGKTAYESAELFTRYLEMTRKIMVENNLMAGCPDA